MKRYVPGYQPPVFQSNAYGAWSGDVTPGNVGAQVSAFNRANAAAKPPPAAVPQWAPPANAYGQFAPGGGEGAFAGRFDPRFAQWQAMMRRRRSARQKLAPDAPDLTNPPPPPRP